MVFFIVGLIAATYSSADSTLTALTTSFTFDILNAGSKEESELRKIRKLVHLGMALTLGLFIVFFRILNDQSVISALFILAGYTYGPLLGLYAFGIFTGYRVRDSYVPFVAVLSPVLTFILDHNSEVLLGGYTFGYELLIINGLFTFAGLLLIRKKDNLPF
jgi:Na+/proline symporter